MIQLKIRLIKVGKLRESQNLAVSYERGLSNLRSLESCAIAQFSWSHLESVLRQIVAPLHSVHFSFANSEAISLGVLVEEVLIECEDTIGVRRRNTGKWHSISTIAYSIRYQ